MERSFRPLKPTQREQQQQQPKQCPRCESTNTKFCYFNNYSQSQPRYFCRACRRYWTDGGTLRNVPQGGGSYRRAKRPKLQGTVSPTTASAPPLPVLNTEFLQAPLMSTATDFGLGTMMLHNMRLPPPPPPQPLFDPNFMIVQQHHHQHMNFAVFTTGATSSSPAVGAASSFWNIDGGEGSSSHPAPPDNPDDLNL